MSYCAQLFYLDCDAYQPLPSWGQFFITLGADIYETLDPDRRLVVAIAVPTRVYAAVLLALGVIANGGGAGNGAAHVDQLSELAIDTPVFLFKEQTDGMYRAKGLYKGYSLKNAGGEEIFYIKVQLDRTGDASREFPLTMWSSIQVAAFPVESMPTRETWRQVTVEDPFTALAVGRRHAKSLAMRSRLECVILGQASALSRETVDTPFAVRDQDGLFVKGRLQDLVRARRFSSGLEAFRSDVLPTDNPDMDKVAGSLSPPLAILDGSAAYLKWRHMFHESNRVIVLDRADRSFEEAVHTLNDEYTLERDVTLEGDGGIDLGFEAAPPGVDVMAFWETAP